MDNKQLHLRIVKTIHSQCFLKFYVIADKSHLYQILPMRPFRISFEKYPNGLPSEQGLGLSVLVHAQEQLQCTVCI